MKRMIGIGLAASAAILAVVPFASGHATVSLLQPQGKALTAARVAYVVRAPNERAKQDTIMLTMYVPEAAQASISVKQTPDWTIVLKRRDTGQVDAEGNPGYAIERVTWIAKKGMRIAAWVLRRMVVPDAEPGDPAADVLPDGPVVLEEDGRREARAGQVERRRRTAPRPHLASTW